VRRRRGCHFCRKLGQDLHQRRRIEALRKEPGIGQQPRADHRDRETVPVAARALSRESFQRCERHVSAVQGGQVVDQGGHGNPAAAGHARLVEEIRRRIRQPAGKRFQVRSRLIHDRFPYSTAGRCAAPP
jgi:hypothetical protein